MSLREYVRHRLIGTPLDPFASGARHFLTALKLKKTPEIRDAILEDDFLKAIVRREVVDGTNCIDVGGHLGAMLNLFLHVSPSGRHVCVEPTPYKAAWLRTRYRSVEVIEAAMAEAPGETVFYHQQNNSGYSGLAKHDAGVNDVEHVTELRVKVETLDRVVPADRKIGFVKIDVEGAEIRVLRGATRILTHDRPTIIFEATESGLTSNGVEARELFELFEQHRYDIRTPRHHLEGGPILDLAAFQMAMHYPFAAFSFLAKPRA